MCSDLASHMIEVKVHVFTPPPQAHVSEPYVHELNIHRPSSHRRFGYHLALLDWRGRTCPACS